MSFRRFVTSLSAEHSAVSARERLLGDRAMRASRNRRVALAHRTALESVPVAGLDAAVPLCRSLQAALLSPQEQRRRVMDVASGFEGHYLATIDFIAERNLTVGLVRPAHCRASSAGEPVQICVDAHGNVSISQLGEAHQAAAPIVIGAWLAALLTLCAALVVLL
ncbi:MAG: hypothetical protein ACUVSU_05150 [Aggregatilineaceae bacterium]